MLTKTPIHGKKKIENLLNPIIRYCICKPMLTDSTEAFKSIKVLSQLKPKKLARL